MNLFRLRNGLVAEVRAKFGFTAVIVVTINIIIMECFLISCSSNVNTHYLFFECGALFWPESCFDSFSFFCFLHCCQIGEENITSQIFEHNYRKVFSSIKRVRLWGLFCETWDNVAGSTSYISHQLFIKTIILKKLFLKRWMHLSFTDFQNKR